MTPKQDTISVRISRTLAERIIAGEIEPDARLRPVLNAAHGLYGDEHGNIYLAEPSPSRVTRLVPLPPESPSARD